jgi:hypothetical protein
MGKKKKKLHILLLTYAHGVTYGAYLCATLGSYLCDTLGSYLCDTLGSRGDE